MIDAFQKTLAFPLDDFQLNAAGVINEGHSVVVCAPTGSGKTLIAEFAAYSAIHSDKRLFYTTPLKALSNQKFYDFKQEYGAGMVGLLTGDVSINREAPIVVMTTEIFRNMLYGIHTEPEYLAQVGYVVLDECHYMNDAQRGTVWEETIIYCPEHIQIIALSATVANAPELTDWINEVHHDTRLIQTDFRPVPLRFSFYDRERIAPLLEPNGKLNRQLKDHRKGNRLAKQNRVFGPNKLIEQMAERNMLPAIFFTFSRKDCEKYLQATADLRLITDLDRRRIRERIAEASANDPYLKNHEHLRYIANGFACHHAGLLPGLKHLVETLFQEGLIQVVFATETLAAGINMPARSTVITKISKRTDTGHRILHANEFHQMAGRAGRRGKDDVGYVIVVSSPYEGAIEAATLVTSPTDPLNSQFTPTYGMALNLLKSRSLAEAEFLIRKSFGQFTSARRLSPLLDEIQAKEDLLAGDMAFECPVQVTDEDFRSFLQSQKMRFETQDFIRVLQKQIKRHGPAPEMLKELKHEEGKKRNLDEQLSASPCMGCDLRRKHQKLMDRMGHLRKQLKQLHRGYDQANDLYWRSFSQIHALLKDQGYLNDQDKPTDRGELAGQIRAENEFFITECVRSGILNTLEPPALAAVICALVNDSDKVNRFTRLHVTPQVTQALQQLDKVARQVTRTQKQFRVNMPVTINPQSSPLVEAWAQGMSWSHLTATTNIQEGDMVRMMRRTADLLRQLAHVNGVDSALIIAARLAHKAIDREPVREPELVVLTPPEPDPLPETESALVVTGDSENSPAAG
ncbi:MAG: DEAD/DEAH box helicase [Candidatus Melainabacteria bacterium]